MYPNLTEFFKQVFGVNIPLPVQTYGLLVASAFLTGMWILKLELKRKEKDKIFSPYKTTEMIGEGAKISELIGNGILGFLLGFKVVPAITNYSELVANPQAFILSSRGSILGALVVAGLMVYLTYRSKNKEKLDKPKKVEKIIHPHELSGSILLVAVVFGLLGAKIFHNLEYFDEFLQHPWESLVSFSGLTFLGGLIIGGLAVILYLSKYKFNLYHMLDVAAVIVPIAYAVGRLGCHISGDGCWGIPNTNPIPEWLAWLPDWLTAYNYPHNVVREGVEILNCTGKYCRQLAEPVYPTSLYESMSMFVIFGILWNLRKKIKTPGKLFSLYLIFGGIERFLIEKIRVNIPYNILGYDITQAEIISSLMVILGIVGIILTTKYKDKILASVNKSIQK